MTLLSPSFIQPLARVILGLAALAAASIGDAAEASPDASARLEAAPCPAVDPELYARQRWIPGSQPYGIPFEAWDRATFDALKRRMTACADPANRQRTLMVLRYLDDPYGPLAQVSRQLDAHRATASRNAGLADEIRAELAAAANDPSLINRRARLVRLATKLDTARLPAETQLALRAELNRETSALAAAEAAQTEAREASARQQRLAEVKAAEDRQREAARAAADREAGEQRQQPQARERAEAEAKAADRYYAGRLASLSPELVTLLTRNPALKAPSARAGLLQITAIVESHVLALDTCRARLGGYVAEWTELQRRLGLMQQALLSYYGMPPSELAQTMRLWQARWENTGMSAALKEDLDFMRETCGGSVRAADNLLDFSR
ncbi:hypothetical protein [Methylobacterium iners]|uniref:Uncharacterized protein n=1 Tax=Methylobacterium iners TaxID=418707 RepID=A0ABQ4S723_9HYPH|nr:hypothetical protein [Methylobacterium iners]GJD97679.1 hypothetical protein OCOJLMKI_4912 [Methylobacterium iners]